MDRRDEEIRRALPADLDALRRLNGFRLRGLEMTRLEGFVDATFAFAITVLIIAGQQVPDDVDALLHAFRDVPAFATSIGVLAIFWKGHWLWSRRFGLEDNVSILISWAMIFTMLIYVYPLKLVFSGMWYGLSNGAVGAPIRVQNQGQARELFALYALGFGAIALQILLLNVRAWRLRQALRLDEREELLTRAAISGWSVPILVGLVSLVLAVLLPPRRLAWSGWVYYSMIVLVPLHNRARRRQLARLDST